MSINITISERVAEHLNSLPSDESKDVNKKLISLLEGEYRRKLSSYSLTDHRLAQKYGLSFEEFEKQKVTQKRNYGWDVESDAIAWETAIDGIRTVKRQLKELIGK